jgi:hypothetical protein
MTTRIVDLDALRQARAEARGEKPVVIFGGEQFELVPEIPIDLVPLWRTGQFKEAMALLLADPAEVDRFWSHRPSDEDITALLESYGEDTAGKSSASSKSSKSSGTGTRRSSKRSTAST